MRYYQAEEIKKKLDELHSEDDRRAFLDDQNAPYKAKENEKAEVVALTETIEQFFPEIKSLVMKVGEEVNFINERTREAAIYIVLGKAYGNLETLLSLAREGRNLEMVEIARSAQESIDLAWLFLIEPRMVDRWFSGWVIKNKESRQVIDDYLIRDVRERLGKDVPIKEMKAALYSFYSNYSHSSYIALLDSIDTYREDFDFEGVLGYRRTKENIDVIKDVIINMLSFLNKFFSELHENESAKGVSVLYEKVLGTELK